jgi:apolipoprotein N-acyltransferase
MIHQLLISIVAIASTAMLSYIIALFIILDLDPNSAMIAAFIMSFGMLLLLIGTLILVWRGETRDVEMIYVIGGLFIAIQLACWISSFISSRDPLILAYGLSSLAYEIYGFILISLRLCCYTPDVE